MSGFNTKEKNNYGEYEIAFYTDNHEDFKKVQDLCRELIDHNKPVSTEGDLISRSDLKEKVNAFYDELFVGCVSNDLIAYASGVDGIIDTAPTVEARPQGEWIMQEGYDGDEYYECSICKDAFTLMCGTPKDNNYNFCPNCGADMRGGAE